LGKEPDEGGNDGWWAGKLERGNRKEETAKWKQDRQSRKGETGKRN